MYDSAEKVQKTGREESISPGNMDFGTTLDPALYSFWNFLRLTLVLS
jgi:hypothetical protein